MKTEKEQERSAERFVGWVARIMLIIIAVLLAATAARGQSFEVGPAPRAIFASFGLANLDDDASSFSTSIDVAKQEVGAIDTGATGTEDGAAVGTPAPHQLRITGARQPVEALKSYFAGRVPRGIALYACQICGDRSGRSVTVHQGEILQRLNASGIGVVPIELVITTENFTRGKAVNILGQIAPAVDGAGLAALVANGFGAVQLGPYGAIVSAVVPVALKLVLAAGAQNYDAAHASRGVLQLEAKLLQAMQGIVLRGDTGDCREFYVLTRFDPKKTAAAYTPPTINIPMEVR